MFNRSSVSQGNPCRTGYKVGPKPIALYYADGKYHNGICHLTSLLLVGKLLSKSQQLKTADGSKSGQTFK